MHVLAIVTDAFCGYGGIAQYNRDLLTALSASASVSRITVLTRLAPKAPEWFPPKLRQQPAIFCPVRFSVAAVKLARALPRDAVVFCGHLRMAPLCAAIARLIGAPMWLQVHGFDAWDRPTRTVLWGAEQADLVTSVSRYTRQRMIGWWGRDPRGIRVLPNTVGAEFQPAPKSTALVHRYALAGRKVLLTVSRIMVADDYKGHRHVLASLPTIAARHPEVLYLIVGDGDGVPRLRDEVVRLQLEDHVRFTGHVSPEELPDHYRAADVFIMPSTREGFGIVFVEAAACGVHVIGGSMDGSVDALRDGNLGEIIDPVDRVQIVSSVCRALEALSSPDPSRAAVFSVDRFNGHVGSIVEEIVAPMLSASKRKSKRPDWRASAA